MKKLLLVAASLGVFGAVSTALADSEAVAKKPTEVLLAEHYTFDKSHTQILFFVDHLGFSKSQGEFHDYDGYFVFNKANPEQSMIDVSIKTASIDMDSEKWNEHMKSADFFNSEVHTDMTFKSTGIEVTGKKTAKITGDLTLLGVTKPVVLETTYNKSDKHPFSGKYVSGFSAKAKVKRSDFGMAYGLPGVGDEVDIRIEVEGYRTESETMQDNEKAE